MLLYDLVLRLANLNAFYTDAGVLPRAAQIEIFSGLPQLFSLHMMNGTFLGESILLFVQFVAALAMLVGYQTWISTFVSWVLLVSLHNRNPMVLQGGDVLLRLLLFWGLFLPLGARASMDRWLAPPRAQATEKYANAPLISLATFAALLQVCFIYWFTWALKTDASWRVDGTAIGYALSIDQLSRPLGKLLLHYPDVMRVLTFVTVELERFGPLVALLPFWRSRLLMVIVFTGFHFTMGLCMTLGVFTFIAPTAWLLFVPSGAWDFANERFGALKARAKASIARARPGIVKWCRRLGMRAPAPREAPFSREIVRQLGAAFFPVLYLRLELAHARLQPLSNLFWRQLELDRFVATHRSGVEHVFAVPLKEDGWFVAAATLNNGRKVDLIADGAPLQWKEPPNLSTTFRDAQWQKYLLNLWPVENAPHRGYYVAYLARQWNEAHAPDQQLKTLDLIYMQQNNLEGFRKDKVKKVVLWNARY